MIKYRIEYKDYFDNACRVDISKDTYSGDIIALRGAEGATCIITRDCEDDPYTPIINTKCAITFFQTEAFEVDILELQMAEDREFRVHFYINNQLKFSGFMIADGIQNSFQQPPFEITITAVCGLSLLSGISYNQVVYPADNEICIMNHIRAILLSSFNLNNQLPIKWTCSVLNDYYSEDKDVFTGRVSFSADNQGVYDVIETGEIINKDCEFILKGFMQSLQCRIVQDDGYWNILRINDVVNGEYIQREIPSDLGYYLPYLVNKTMVTSLSLINNKKNNGDYSFIDEDALIYQMPSLRYITSTYKHTQRDNILPNGGMDLITDNGPLYWNVTGGSAYFTSENSIYRDRGYSVQVNVPSDTSFCHLNLSGGLPIDTDVLYETFNLSFKFIPASGLPVDGNGIIQWSNNIILNVYFVDNDDNTYYLNEFGWWSPVSVGGINITIPNAKLGDVVSVNFDKFQNISFIIPSDTPISMTRPPSIYMSFRLNNVLASDMVVLFDDVQITIDKTKNDVYKAENIISKNTNNENYELNISSSHNGFYFSNYMTDWGQSGIEKFFSDKYASGVTLTEMNSRAIMRNRYKPSLVFEGSIYGSQYSYCEIYEIETLDGKKFLPLRSEWNTETNTIRLTAVEVRDDDIYLNVTHNGYQQNE